MDLIYFLFIIAVIILLVIIGKQYIPFALLFVKQGGDECCTDYYQEEQQDKYHNEEHQVDQLFEEDNIIVGSADSLREYLNGSTLSNVPHATTDAKNLTLAKLKSVSQKQFPLESFVDSLISNTLTYLISLETIPTDLAVANIAKNKAILLSAADILEKKYPDSRINVSDIRALVDKIISKSKSVSDKLIRLGNISKEEISVKYCALLGVSFDPECKTKLQICENRKTTLTDDIESIRKANETLREELRRGISSHNCEVILRECREEKDRLERRIRDLQHNTSSADEQRRRADKLQIEVDELRGIANLLQNDNATQNQDYQQRLARFQVDLNECDQYRQACITQLSALGIQ